ncbi:Isoleucine--tRNA ligase [Actinidia chinensis var. chinensis]|uniref:Isoleucine--tRNA ligase n=1 Tax=Actinidia chinensis var. chinensis TaxID=1590841 RepID=A0A2R6RYS2_ACTCC|nr:Isoleucine--tRNA ligase [Actinidia chinensis var. chinensis]
MYGLQIKEWSAGVICKLDIEFLLYLLIKDGFWAQVEELDSGSSRAFMLEKRSGLNFPVDLYLEGTDESHGWFQSYLLTSILQKVPRESLLFVFPDFGDMMSWEGQGAPFNESDQSITHQVCHFALKYGCMYLFTFQSQMDTELNVMLAWNHFRRSMERFVYCGAIILLVCGCMDLCIDWPI